MRWAPRPGFSARATRVTSLGLLVVVALGSHACAGAASREGTQPAPDVTTFEQGVFDDVPRFPRSEPLGSRSEKAGVVAQSFRAFGASPRAVLEYYARSLAGWQQVEPITRTGTVDFRARWATDRWTLLVTAAPAPTTSDGNQADVPEPKTQYSLTLSPT